MSLFHFLSRRFFNRIKFPLEGESRNQDLLPIAEDIKETQDALEPLVNVLNSDVLGAIENADSPSADNPFVTESGVPADFITNVNDTATIDLDVTSEVLTADFVGDTDDVPEGVTNLYFTSARVVAASYYRLIAKSGLTVVGSNTLAEEVLASVLIPANTLGNNDELRAWGLFDATGGAAGNRIFRIRLHTATTVGGTVYQQTTLGVGGGGYRALACIQMKNASNSQEGFGQLTAVFGTGSNAVTSALSTASDMYILFTSLKVVSGADNATLRNYTVEHIALPSA